MLAFSCGVVYVIANGLILTLFISCCWNHAAFYKMFQYYVQKFDEKDSSRNDTEALAKLAKFHATTKE